MLKENRVLISIIMAAFNEEKNIRESIESILTQTYKNWELIIVNDASTDNTRHIIAQIQSHDYRIVLIDNISNEGLAKSLNTAIMHSKGEYIARMDADDIALPERLERQVNFLLSNSDIDVLGTGVIAFNRGSDYRFNMYRQESHFLMEKNIYKECPFIHPTVMAKKTFFIENNGYDTSLKRGQDYDLWLRTYKKYKFYNIQEQHLLYHYRISYKWRDTSYAAKILIKHIQLNRLHFFNYWFPFRLILAFFKKSIYR